MVQRRVISIFLLCLLLAINWHNTFFHSHHGFEEGQVFAIGQHDHDHPHFQHRHDHPTTSFWDRIKRALGDFEHPDLGDDHLELFLRPYHHMTSDQALGFSLSLFIITPQNLQTGEVAMGRNAKIPVEVLSFSDPPFLENIGIRGPPSFF